MDCPNQDENLSLCNCTYEPCSRKGRCCECIQYHLRSKELPACVFSSEDERTYDRSFRRFIKSNS
jgi:pyrimidine deaminase RibD-like protein